MQEELKYKKDVFQEEDVFEYEPDIKALIEQVQMGPQARVLELIDAFNDNYINNPVGDNYRRSYYYHTGGKELGITKKFYWKPGAYDIIKQVVYYQQELYKKANSLTKVVERARETMSYRMRGLMNNISEIEAILVSFRAQGQIMQDNTDDVVEAWNVLKNHISQQYEASNQAFKLKLETVYSNNDNSTIIDYYIAVTYNYDDVIIKYRHVGAPDHLAEILIPGEGHLTIKISVSRAINAILLAKNMDVNNIPTNSVVSRRNNHKRWLYNIGGYYNTFPDLHHPYIAREGSYYTRTHTDTDFRYVCVGNMDTEIEACIKSLDFISLKIFFDRIMTHYDTNTGPLNRIETAYHGNPNFLESNTEYYSIVGKRLWQDCNYTSELRYLVETGMSLEESYCDKYCSIRAKCDAYQEAVQSTKPLTPEQVTQKALEHATLQLVNQGRQ